MTGVQTCALPISIISGDKDFAFDDSDAFTKAGFTRQEFDENEELVDIEEEEPEEDDAEMYDDAEDGIFDEE